MHQGLILIHINNNVFVVFLGAGDRGIAHICLTISPWAEPSEWAYLAEKAVGALTQIFA